MLGKRGKGSLFLLALLLVLLVFILSVNFNTVRNVSAVITTSGLGVYWEASCVNSVTQINWGNVTPGATQRIYVYIRNEQQASAILLMTTSDWAPEVAYQYISCSWNYDDLWVKPNEVVKVALLLSVSRFVQGVTNFSFVVEISSSLTMPGDFDNDGKVDYRDLYVMALAYGSTATSPNWNPAADINGDGKVDYRDLNIFLKFFGR